MPEITIKDIAKRCGVGVSTVSRAINNHPDINQETKGITNPFFSDMIQVIEEETQKKKYSLVLKHVEYYEDEVDDRKESYAMTSYLLDLGHKKIAILSAESEINSIGQLRLEGYKDALKEKGLPFNENLVRCVKEGMTHYSMKNGYVTTKELIASGEKFTAVYATADILAIGACSGA